MIGTLTPALSIFGLPVTPPVHYWKFNQLALINSDYPNTTQENKTKYGFWRSRNGRSCWCGIRRFHVMVSLDVKNISLKYALMPLEDILILYSRGAKQPSSNVAGGFCQYISWYHASDMIWFLNPTSLSCFHPPTPLGTWTFLSYPDSTSLEHSLQQQDVPWILSVHFHCTLILI